MFTEPVNLWTSSIELPKVLLPSAVDIMFVTNSLAVTLPPTVISPVKLESPSNLDEPFTSNLEDVICPLELMFPCTLNIGSSTKEPLKVLTPENKVFNWE